MLGSWNRVDMQKISVFYKPDFCAMKYSSETQVSDRERRHCFSHHKNSQQIAPNLPIYVEPQGILSTFEGGTLGPVFQASFWKN